MASACVNDIGIPPESFLDCPPVKCPSYGWLSPRFSFSREYPGEEGSTATSNKPTGMSQRKPDNAEEETPGISDPDIPGNSFIDFEFRLVDPVAMLTADELFSDGKLVPLHLSTIRRSIAASHPEARSEHAPEFRRRMEMSTSSKTDPYLFSPKAPSCTARWKEILGLKKLYKLQQNDDAHHKTTSSSKACKSLKQFLPHHNNRGSSSSPLNLPLLKEPLDSESLSISSRLSLSSSSSSGHDDLPRLSLDSDKPSAILRKIRVASNNNNNNKQRSADNQAAAAAHPPADSPRMNSSGKIVFHGGLERSSSSPSAFNGGPRPYRSRGMERSYSANVRITPVLNVPVCSLRGSSKSGGVFGGLFATQQQQQQHRKDGASKNRT